MIPNTSGEENGRISKTSDGSKPKDTKSLPYGVTQEAWDATANLRKQYHKLAVLEQAHSQKKHPWSGYCTCPEMRETQQHTAFLMNTIKTALLPPVNSVDALIERRKAARTLAEINAIMFSPDEISKILTEVNDLKPSSPDTNSRPSESPNLPPNERK